MAVCRQLRSSRGIRRAARVWRGSDAVCHRSGTVAAGAASSGSTGAGPNAALPHRHHDRERPLRVDCRPTGTTADRHPSRLALALRSCPSLTGSFPSSPVAQLARSNVGRWPGPGFPGGRRKLTLAGSAVALKVSFLAGPRTDTGGQERSSGMVGRTTAPVHATSSDLPCCTARARPGDG